MNWFLRATMQAKCGGMAVAIACRRTRRTAMPPGRCRKDRVGLRAASHAASRRSFSDGSGRPLRLNGASSTSSRLSRGPGGNRGRH